MVKQKVDR